MANKLDEQQRAIRVASKQDRERDAAIAMQEYEAENGLRVLCGSEAGVGTELIGSLPKTLFQRMVGGIFL